MNVNINSLRVIMKILNHTKLSVFLSCCLLANVAFAKDDKFAQVVIKTQQLTDSIYMLTGEGGNIGVSVGDDGVFMIDDQFAPLSDKIQAAIAKISTKPIKFLINTHWHYDHTGGNENIGESGVVIVAHDNVRQRMSHDNFIQAFNKKIPASPKIALPAITFNDNITFHLNNQEIQVVHQPSAHTDGDSIILFKTANVVHMGDIFFNGLYPFIDASSGGDVDGMIDAVNKALENINAQTKIIPGHGPLANKADLVRYRDMLVLVTKRMKKLINQGKTIDEIIALKPNADLDKNWGKGFLSPAVFLTILHGVIKQN